MYVTSVFQFKATSAYGCTMYMQSRLCVMNAFPSLNTSIGPYCLIKNLHRYRFSKSFLCPSLNATDVSIGDLLSCLASNQSLASSILIALFLRNMTLNVWICIEGYKCRLLLNIPCLSS
ncbi:hypothetical protein RO3G_08119 [Rhizopus delemar RA 99-880]|uniref:Uncharacterized protein n=1 Tax=Rhizopus delemar (strain RA 99-880 / ATCC MYA-4621 / FGSC 9543 / NRRL 43880) TaxID=246409 RepID=I1C4N4_RHIO9|nr:hypothetical protein RO3G_08119 [Rhizopus delemar RA 99-880]|eukprot:EIE83414.1 hypothetical protein RO3G_08119 [Rhizopus delemar RA 99-880]